MSYNIDTWKTKELAGLTLPLEAVYELPDAEVHLERAGVVSVTAWCEGFEITGKKDGDNLLVNSIELWGEGSGTSWRCFKDLLAASSGRLVATQIWEGGDSITRLTVQDGKVDVKQVEI